MPDAERNLPDVSPYMPGEGVLALFNGAGTARLAFEVLRSRAGGFLPVFGAGFPTPKVSMRMGVGIILRGLDTPIGGGDISEG